MGEALAANIRGVSERFELTQADLARVLGASPRAVSRWCSGQAMPRHLAKQRLLELVAVGDELHGLLQPEDSNLWIFSPNPILDHDSPADRISEGDFKSVIALINAMKEGVFT